MASFEQAIPTVLDNEGGLSNNPLDAGGLTNFGISQRSYPDVDIKNLTRGQAAAIYQKDFWHDAYNNIASQRVATKVFDSSVNLGPVRAVRLLQLALGAIEAGPIVADGILGSHTVECVNAADEEKLMDEFKARLCKYYADLNQPEFTLGWLRRAVKG